MSERIMSAENQQPPKHVRIYYSVGPKGTHVFESRDLRGLHIVDPDLERAFDLVVNGVHALVRSMYGIDVKYTTDRQFEDFKACLNTSSDDGLPVYASKPILNVVAHAV